MSSDLEAALATEDVERLGRELGEAITELPEYAAFEAAQEEVKADEAVQAKIQDFEGQRHEFMLARQVGDATEDDLQALQETQQELHAMPVMAEFLAAQEELRDRLETINKAISEPLTVDFGGEAGGCCQD